MQLQDCTAGQGKQIYIPLPLYCYDKGGVSHMFPMVIGPKSLCIVQRETDMLFYAWPEVDYMWQLATGNLHLCQCSSRRLQLKLFRTIEGSFASLSFAVKSLMWNPRL